MIYFSTFFWSFSFFFLFFRHLHVFQQIILSFFFFFSPQVHVGEYGVHWNFFFTLAAVAILTFLVNVHPNYCGILGSFVLIGMLYNFLFSFWYDNWINYVIFSFNMDKLICEIRISGFTIVWAK